MSSLTITLQKQVNKQEANEGEIITYTLTYTNTGNTQATNIVTSDNIPTNTTYIDNSAIGSYTYDNNTLIWTIDTLEAGEEGSVSFEVVIDEGEIGSLDRKHLALLSIATIGVLGRKRKKEF